MRLKGKYSKKVYLIIFLVLLFGIILQISRSEFVLKSQKNGTIIAQRDELFQEIESQDVQVNTGSTYCVVYNESQDLSVKTKENIMKSLGYMKKKSIEINQGKDELNYSKCNVIISSTSKIKDIGSAEEIANYVSNGGYVFFTSVLDLDKDYNLLYRKLGITSFSDYVDAIGVHLVSNVLFNEKGLKLDEDFIHNVSINVTLETNSELLVESQEKTPILWKNQYGKGAFLVYNGTVLEEKVNRGIIIGGLSLLEPNFIYPVFNAKTFYIDDFPAPIARGTHEAIYKEYQMDIPTFYREIWWPSMLKVAHLDDFKYTGMVIESYNDHVKPPFDNTDDKDSHYLISYGRELVKSGGEIGFHGYNHQSFASTPDVSDDFGYNYWEKSSDMEEAIKELENYTSGAFPGYKITSYVPPSNVLSELGRKALKNTLPNLTVIASVYAEDGTGNAFVQEFGLGSDNIIDMPRITSGYYESQFNRWIEANTMTSLGVFSHFVHPDDVMSDDRNNNMSWEKLQKHFEKYMKRVNKSYPWLRSMTATEAAIDLLKHLKSTVNITQNDKQIYGEITNFRAEQSFILRTENKIRKVSNCEIEEIDDNTFLVVAKDSKFSIVFAE